HRSLGRNCAAFFFQAEDGIRDRNVTGVQTCALPISLKEAKATGGVIYWATVSYITPPVALASFSAAGIAGSSPMKTSINSMKLEIGRASCRERVSVSSDAVVLYDKGYGRGKKRGRVR